MTSPLPKLYTAQIEGDFVLFLIGMRVRRFWKVHKIFTVQRAMGRMITELRSRPELGLLHAQAYLSFPGFMLVQYWRSFDHLERYANDPGLAHASGWQSFVRQVGYGGDVGVWHETYLIEERRYEALYGAMPRFGLACAGRAVPLTGETRWAAQRLGGMVPKSGAM